MKKMTKAFSIVMALVMMLSVAVLPVNAAVPSDAHVSFDLKLAPVIGETDSKGVKSEDAGIYKLTIYLTSDVRLYGIIMDIIFDNTRFDPIRSGNNYSNFATTSGKTTAVKFNKLGQMLDNKEYDDSGNVTPEAEWGDVNAFYYAGPSATVVATSYEFKFTRQLATLVPAENAILWNYEPADYALELGNCTNEPVAELYFRLKDGQTADGAVFGFGKTGDPGSAKSVTFDGNPDLGKFHVQANADYVNIMPLDLIGTPDYTYTAPVPAGPTITKLGSQIRFNGLESAPGANDADFDIRTRAKVSKADMMTLLGTDEAGLTAALKTAGIRMGFVYQATVNGPFVADDAKAAAIAGTTQGSYFVKDVKYAAYEGTDILWTCFIDDAKYDGEVIALPYIILGGNAYFLDGTITCNFSDGYNAKYTDYANSQKPQP